MKYKLEKSKEREGWWVLTDTEYLVSIIFEEHRFNETQRTVFLNDCPISKADGNSATKLAGILRQMGEYLFSHWYSIALPTPVYELRLDDATGRTLLIRNKYPRFTVELQDEASIVKVADALKKAGEFLRKQCVQ